MRLVFVGIITSVLSFGGLHAGPYYNPPSESSDETKAAIGEFEQLLNSARQHVIAMFDEWELNSESANENRFRAIDSLSKAEEVLQSVLQGSLRSEVSEIALNYEHASEQRTRSITMFLQVLEAYGIERPNTYADLLNVAVEMVGNYRRTLEETELQQFPGGWEQARQALMTDIDVVVVGSAVSILVVSYF